MEKLRDQGWVETGRNLGNFVKLSTRAIKASSQCMRPNSWKNKVYVRASKQEVYRLLTTNKLLRWDFSRHDRVSKCEPHAAHLIKQGKGLAIWTWHDPRPTTPLLRTWSHHLVYERASELLLFVPQPPWFIRLTAAIYRTRKRRLKPKQHWEGAQITRQAGNLSVARIQSADPVSHLILSPK